MRPAFHKLFNLTVMEESLAALCFAVLVLATVSVFIIGTAMIVWYIAEKGPGAYSSTILFIRNLGRQRKQRSAQHEVHAIAELDRVRMINELRLFFDQADTTDGVMERKSWLLRTIESINETTGTYRLKWKSK